MKKAGRLCVKQSFLSDACVAEQNHRNNGDDQADDLGKRQLFLEKECRIQSAHDQNAAVFDREKHRNIDKGHDVDQKVDGDGCGYTAKNQMKGGKARLPKAGESRFF